MSLSKTLYPLLSTGSTQEDPSQHDLKIVHSNQTKQNNNKTVIESPFYHITSHLREIYPGVIKFRINLNQNFLIEHSCILHIYQIYYCCNLLSEPIMIF